MYPLKLTLEFVVLAVLSTVLFAVLAAAPSGVATLVGVTADVTPLPWGPEPTTAVAVFLGVAFGAGFGLTSRVPPFERSGDEPAELASDESDYSGRYRFGPINRSSTNVQRDLYALLNLLRVSVLVGIGVYLVESPPTDLPVSGPALVMTYAFVDEMLYGLDFSVGPLLVSSPSGYVYIMSARLINFVYKKTGVIELNKSFPESVDQKVSESADKEPPIVPDNDYGKLLFNGFLNFVNKISPRIKKAVT